MKIRTHVDFINKVNNFFTTWLYFYTFSNQDKKKWALGFKNQKIRLKETLFLIYPKKSTSI